MPRTLVACAAARRGVDVRHLRADPTTRFRSIETQSEEQKIRETESATLRALARSGALGAWDAGQFAGRRQRDGDGMAATWIPRQSNGRRRAAVMEWRAADRRD